MPHFLVLGDSHANVFSYCNEQQTEIKFEKCLVPGASAQGLVNPNSTTDALKTYEEKLNQAIIKYDKILIMIGEVDCGFVIWLRSKKYNIPVDQQIHQCVNNLFTFINSKILQKGYQPSQVIVVGSVLPTIKDSTNKKYLNGSRSEVTASQLQRTKKTLYYNQLLKNKSMKLGINYIDITQETMGDDGLIQNKYLSADPYDHHLSNVETYQIWLEKLKSLI